MADPATWIAIGNWLVANWQVVAFIATTAYTYDQQRRQRARARQQYNKGLRDRLVMVDLDVNSPRTIAYGRVRAVEGVRRRFTSGEHGEHLTMIVSFAGHEIDGFESFFFNDKALTLDEDGWVQTAPYIVGKRRNRSATVTSASPTFTVTEPKASLLDNVFATGMDDGDNGTPTFACSVSGQTITVDVPADYYGPIYITYQVRIGQSKARIRPYLGTATQNVGADLASEYPDQIKATDAYKGIALAVVDLLFDEDVYTSGIPNITALFRGKKVRDPRTNSVAWSENPALIAYDYARHPNGFDIGSEAEVLAPTIADTIASANVCDVSTNFRVDTQSGKTQTYTLPRYRCGIQISTDADPKSSMNEIMETMAGRWGWSGGSFRFKAGSFTEPVATLTPSWIMQPLGDDGELPDDAPVKLYNGVPRESKINIVTGTFVDPNDRWQPGDFPAVKDEPAITADGAEYPDEVEFQGVNHIAHAGHLASIKIRKNEASLRGQFSCGLAAYKLELFDVFAADLPRFFGSLDKTFEVVGWKWSPSTGIVLQTEETTALIYTPNFKFNGKDPAPDSRLPSPWEVPDIENLAADSGTEQLIMQSDGTVTTRVRVSWKRITDQSVYLSGKVELRWGRLRDDVDDWHSIIVPGDQTSLYIVGPRDGTQIGIVARAINSVPVNGDWTTILRHTVIGKSAPPSDVTGFRARLERYGIRLRWDEVPDLDLRYYEVRETATPFSAGALVVRTRDTDYLLEMRAAATYSLSIKARDRSGNYSENAATVSIAIAPPSMTSIDAGFSGQNIVLRYAGAAGSYAIAGYEIREGDSGDSFGASTLVTTRQSTRFSTKVDWVAHTYWVLAYDAQGNRGAPISIDVSILAPPQVPPVTAQVIDNTVLLRWTAPVGGTLPIADYIVRRGPNRPSATLIGHAGTKTFTTVFEEVAGTFTYWVSAVDSSGAEGPARSVVATVDQPPDYVLRLDFSSTFAGTKTNMYVADGDLFGPVLTETIATHFSSRGWSTPADQIAAGYPAFYQPSASSGSYSEVIDYGALLPSSTITVTLNIEVLAGSATWSMQVSYRATTADAWIDGPADASRIQASNFRYVRVTLTFAAAGGDDLVKVSELKVKLSAKNRTDQGSGTANASDSTGTFVPFNVAFVDAEAPVVTPTGTAARTAVVNFADVPNPTGFRVLLFDTNGNRVSGGFSWTARGF